MKHRKAHTVFPVVYFMNDSPDILIISRLWNKADSPPKAVSERMRAVFIFVEISMPYNIGTPLPISRYADMMVHASPEKYLHIRFPANGKYDHVHTDHSYIVYRAAYYVRIRIFWIP